MNAELERQKEIAQRAFTKLLVPTEEEVQKIKQKYKIQNDINDTFLEELELSANAKAYEIGTYKYPIRKRIVNLVKLIFYKTPHHLKSIRKSNVDDFWWRLYNRLRIYCDKKQKKISDRISLENREVELKRKALWALPNEKTA